MSRSPSAEESAAIAAAVERFLAETASVGAAEEEEAIGPWQRAALAEGAGAKGTVQKHLEGGLRWQS